MNRKKGTSKSKISDQKHLNDLKAAAFNFEEKIIIEQVIIDEIVEEEAIQEVPVEEEEAIEEVHIDNNNKKQSYAIRKGE